MSEDLSERRCLLVAEQTGQVVYERDISSGEIIWLGALEFVTGYTAEECAGINTKMWEELIHPEDRYHVLTLLKKASCSYDKYEIEYRLKRKDGSYTYVEDNGVFLCGGENKQPRIIGTLKEISARKRMENDLLRAKENAETANRAKSEFLANMSHELRTPLNAVIGFSSLLQESDLLDSQRKWVGIVKSEGEHLLAIINDILDLARIEADHLELSVETFSLRETMMTLLDSISASIRDKPLKLECDIPEQIPDALLGDALRLRQVLANLLGNAVKFTEKGVVQLGVEAVSRNEIPSSTQDESSITEGHSIFLRFTVGDTGIGVPKNLQEKIFRPFTQADGSYTRRYGGTGLGLAICRRLVEKLGGKIQLESELGKGSVFTFTAVFGLPSEAMPEAGIHTSSLMEEKSLRKARKLHLLVVEDNPTNASLIQEMLSLAEHSSVVTWTGTEALTAMKTEHFDAILIDLHIPDINGLELVAKIREREKSHGINPIPLIAVTAHAMKGDQERCLQAGMNAYIPKPIDKNALLDAINTSVMSRR